MSSSVSLRAVKHIGTAVVASGVIAAGCAGGGSGTATFGGPPPNPSPSPVGQTTVHINFFGSAAGTQMSSIFGTVRGYTQNKHSQVLGLAPGAQIVITNNDTAPHTLNVYSGGYPNPATVNTSQTGGNVLQAGYQSGVLAPGASTPVLTVGAAGTYYIVCGIHYQTQVPFMQDGLIVQVGAVPGPEATPSSGGGGCIGYGCT